MNYFIFINKKWILFFSVLHFYSCFDKINCNVATTLKYYLRNISRIFRTYDF